MKKLSLLLLLLMVQAPVFCEIAEGLSEIAHGARRVLEGAADTIVTPFEGIGREEIEDIEYREDIAKAKAKRDKAAKDIAENGPRGWFGKKADPQVEYAKDVRKAEIKRDKARERRRAQEAKEAERVAPRRAVVRR